MFCYLNLMFFFTSIVRFAKMNKEFKAQMASHGGCPTKEDWESVERLVQFLEHFHKLTKKISGSWYVTSNI